jgi:ammonium transporter Rh
MNQQRRVREGFGAVASLTPTKILPWKRFFVHVVLWLTLAAAYSCVAQRSDAPPRGTYSMFQDIHVMIFIGFALIMAPKYSSVSALSQSMLVAVLAAVFFIPNFWVWHALLANHAAESETWQRVSIGIDVLVGADFCAGAVLISFGALTGRVSIVQLLIIAAFEVVFYSINEALAYGRFAAADIGGSMVIHMFGAYFGLTVSLLLDRTPERRLKRAGKWASDHSSDTLAMVGTLFLWCFWPSFNSYLGGQINNGGSVVRPVVNTYLSLCGSVAGTYLLSGLLGRGKFSIVDFQNASLAGGVAMGTAANMLCKPYGALLIGTAAGAVSTFGYRWLQPRLERWIGLMDTCGIHNLHGMPSVVGALIGVLVTAAAKSEEYAATGFSWAEVWINVEVKQQSVQGLVGFQFATLFCTLGIAIAGGVVAALFLRVVPVNNLYEFYTDDAEWEVEAAQEIGNEQHQQELTQMARDEAIRVLITQSPTSAGYVAGAIPAVPPTQVVMDGNREHDMGEAFRVGA